MNPQVVIAADVTVLWLFPREDHAAWSAAGLGDLAYDCYRRQLAEAESLLAAEGVRTARFRARVADVVELMRRHRLPNDPLGRTVAVTLLYWRSTDVDAAHPQERTRAHAHAH